MKWVEILSKNMDNLGGVKIMGISKSNSHGQNYNIKNNELQINNYIF